MLSYDEALQRILDRADALPAETLAVTNALGRALAENITAPESLPSFDNSAVDGYAVQAEWTRTASLGTPIKLQMAGEVRAGDSPESGDTVVDNTAVYITTGAMIPEGADSVVMVEDTWRGDLLDLFVTAPASAKFIRRAGSDVKQGELILQTGDQIGAGTIGLLSALGITKTAVHTLPRVGILSTGTELIPADTQVLPPAKIRDSNGPALEAVVIQAGGIVEARLHAPDDPRALRDALESLAGCDVVLSSGGVSMGDADYIKGILEEIGTLDFWRIAIKPGKPLAFGSIGNALFFGLPGNPVSSLVTFELFVRPVLRRLAGHKTTTRPQTTATLTHHLSHEPGRREFVRASLEYRDGEAFATPTGAQGSHRISSLLGADTLLIAHEEHGDYAAGDKLPALLLAQ